MIDSIILLGINLFMDKIMIRGLFVPYWFIPIEYVLDYTKEDFEVDTLLMINYAKSLGISDLYIYVKTYDKRCIAIEKHQKEVGFDLLGFVSQHWEPKRIHAAFTTRMLFSQENYISQEERPELPDEWIYLNGTPRDRISGFYELDFTIPEARQFVIDRIKAVVAKYPEINVYYERSYYLPRCSGRGTFEEKKEGLNNFAEDLSRECRAIRPLIISSSSWLLERLDYPNPSVPSPKNDREIVEFNKEARLQDTFFWIENGWIDYTMPMLFRCEERFSPWVNRIQKHPLKDKMILTLGCHNKSADDLVLQIHQVKDFNLAFWSYDAPSGEIDRELFKSRKERKRKGKSVVDKLEKLKADKRKDLLKIKGL